MATTAPVPRGITAKNRKHLASLYMRINGPFSVQEASEALLVSDHPDSEIPRLPCREGVARARL